VGQNIVDGAPAFLGLLKHCRNQELALIADPLPLGALEADRTVADLVLEVFLRFDWLKGV